MKPTREGDNLPSRSTPIRKGKMSKEEIKKTAEELTRLQKNAIYLGKCMGVTTDEAINNINNSLQVVKAPKPEPVVKGDYKAFATSIKSKFQTNDDTVEITGDYMKSLFPQVKCAGDVAKNLKRYYGLSYRRVENGRNDTYVFFIEPTREELIVQLTSAETKVIELKSYQEKQSTIIGNLKSEIEAIQEVNDEFIKKIGEENTQLKSELSNQKIDKLILFAFAIGAVITILFKSVAL